MTELKRVAGCRNCKPRHPRGPGSWRFTGAVGLSLVLLVWGAWACPPAVAQGPAPSPSDVSESPSEAPPTTTAEEPAVEEEAVDEAAAEPKPAYCATCRPKRLGRLKARLRCALGRLPRLRAGRCCCATAPDPEAKKPDPYAWKPLFDGKTLKGWKAPNFGGQGEVKVKDGMIVMETGADMTGITYTGEAPENNYEVAFEAQRLGGIDFFATTTFRVGKDPLTLVVGGWGGTVVGLSNVDFYDASDNMTTKFHDFKDKTWYKVRIRVTDAKVECWIDDEKMVDQRRKGHKFGIRWECELCQPLGISTWCTTGAVRNIRMRKLSPKEIEAAEKEAAKEAENSPFG